MAENAPPPPPPQEPPGPPQAGRNWKKIGLWAGAIVVALIIIGALIPSEDEADETADRPGTTTAEAATTSATTPSDEADQAEPFDAARLVASGEATAWTALAAGQKMAVARRWVDATGSRIPPRQIVASADQLNPRGEDEPVRGFLDRAAEPIRAQARAEAQRQARQRQIARQRAARERAAAQARARAEAAAQARAEAEARARAEADAQASQCDPNYEGACVPPYPPDVNCADIGTSVAVVGSDPHGLDRDNDGYGCESS